MPPRRPDLLRPRSLALLLAGLAGSHLASRLRVRLRPPRPGTPAESPPEPDRFPAPLLGCAIVVVCAIGAAAYLGWLGLRDAAKTRAVAVALTGGQPDLASSHLIRYGCAGCHTVPGVPGADGKVAAPLTGMRSRVYVAGVLPNTAENLVAWIVDPPAFSPRTAMPVTGITEGEARDVAAYLYTR